MLAEKRAEFIKLFREFADSYPPTPQGEYHLRHYEEEREQGRRNFEAILEAERQGEDVTDQVLMKLLPYVHWSSVKPKKRIELLADSGSLRQTVRNLCKVSTLPHV